jgi:hypothetical protein
MSVNRLWFPNTPSGTVDMPQQAQIAVGYSGILPSVFDIVDYYRRYLQDTLTVQTIGPLVSLPAGTETADTTYMRRYLQDTL